MGRHNYKKDIKTQNNVISYITLRDRLTVSAGREPLPRHFPPTTEPPSGTIDPLPANNRIHSG